MSDTPTPYTPPAQPPYAAQQPYPAQPSMNQPPYAVQPGSYSPSIYPAPRSIAGPVNVIAIIHFVLAGFALIGFIVMLAAGLIARPELAADDPAHAALGSAFIFAIAAIVLVLALMQFLVGYGLLTFKPWGRILAIVFSCLNLLSFPFGTALGGFTLYFLLRSGAAEEFQHLAMVNQRR